MTTDPRDEFRSAGVLVSDMVDLLLGEHLGGGLHREVFVLAQDPRWVVKLETSPEQGFQNVKEWEVWRDLQHHEPSARWLAPCRAISPNGRVLIQARTQPMRSGGRPLRVPAWCADVKEDNWGRYRGRPVMHDYGLTLLHRLGSVSRMKDAHW